MEDLFAKIAASIGNWNNPAEVAVRVWKDWKNYGEQKRKERKRMPDCGMLGLRTFEFIAFQCSGTNSVLVSKNLCFRLP